MISVIVPVYNVEQYLRKCVDSILAQTYPEIEIILVDDGSTDSSSTICDTYVNEYPGKVRTVHTENKGVSSARNCGISVAKGEFVGFVDGDDWIEPDMFATLFSNIDKTNCCLSICSVKADYDQEQLLLNKSLESRILCGTELAYAFLNDYSILGYACNKLFRTDLARQTLFDEALFSSEDIDFCTRYLQITDKAVVTPSELYHYRQRADSVTGIAAYSFRKLSVIKAHEKILPIYKAKYPRLAYIVEKYLLKQCLNVLGRMKISDVKDPELRKSLKNKADRLLLKVLREKNNSISEKLNILLTRAMPGNLLRIKQWILKRRNRK